MGTPLLPTECLAVVHSVEFVKVEFGVSGTLVMSRGPAMVFRMMSLFLVQCSLVVSPPQVVLSEHRVRLGYLSKFLVRLLAALVVVGVVLHGELVVCVFHLAVSGVGRDVEYGVVIFVLGEDDTSKPSALEMSV